MTALVEIRGEMKETVFLTNNLGWSARTTAELYRARWGIETFFKELKQTCQMHDFIFSRLSGVIRGSLWLKKRLLSLLELYGTAGAVIIPRHRVKSLYFQPLLNFANAPNGIAGLGKPRNAASYARVLA